MGQKTDKVFYQIATKKYELQAIPLWPSSFVSGSFGRLISSAVYVEATETFFPIVFS